MNNMRVKKVYVSISLIFSCFVSVFLCSCSQSQQTDEFSAEEKTLRAQASKLDSSTPWTAELEPNVLTRDIVHSDGISPKVKISPQSILAGGQESRVAPVYPYLPGFGSLDVSKLDEEAKVVIKKFADAVCMGGSADSTMAEGCLYSLALFYKDIDALMPQKKDVTESIAPISDAPASDADKNIAPQSDAAAQSAEKTPPEDASAHADVSAPPSDAAQTTVDSSTPTAAAAPVKMFDSYIIGEPFTGDTIFQVPVRFITANKDTLDIVLYMNDENASWKIDQIQIRKWEAADGRQ